MVTTSQTYHLPYYSAMQDYNDYEALLSKYPYFAYAALKAIPLAPDEESRDELRRIVAVNIGDPADAAEVLGLNSESLADFYPDALLPKLSTFDTIDTFLSTFGNERRESGASGQQPIPVAPDMMNPDLIGASGGPEGDATADDTGEGANEVIGKASASDSTASAIDAFLAAVPPPAPRRVRHAELPKEEDSPALTESFARILIKNRNYEKALQIIQDLNLKNPEKSVYFADQIRFLKKLILNESRKKH